MRVRQTNAQTPVPRQTVGLGVVLYSAPLGAFAFVLNTVSREPSSIKKRLQTNHRTIKLVQFVKPVLHCFHSSCCKFLCEQIAWDIIVPVNVSLSQSVWSLSQGRKKVIPRGANRPSRKIPSIFVAFGWLCEASKILSLCSICLICLICSIVVEKRKHDGAPRTRTRPRRTCLDSSFSCAAAIATKQDFDKHNEGAVVEHDNASSSFSSFSFSSSFYSYFETFQEFGWKWSHQQC